MDNKKDGIIKTEFNFGWKEWGESIPHYAEMTLKHEKGDILDVGCATCELYRFLKSHGWKGKYYGIDIKKYDGYEYPKDVNLIIGDPMDMKLPEVDTVILYNILEHVNDPAGLLKKAIKTSKKNVLINIPKRNEELWNHGIVEYHQLDKTHKHCGFSKEEIYNLVDMAGGKIVTYKEFGAIDAMKGVALWNNIIPKLFNFLLNRIFSSRTFYMEIWCEVMKKGKIKEKTEVHLSNNIN